MAELYILGSPNSTYLRTTRMACEEKGVPYELKAVGEDTLADLKSPAHLAKHPFGRIPVMEHGDFILFESTAICRYVDEIFDGPALQPGEPRERALMMQWVTATIDYMAPVMLGRFVAQFIFPKGADGQPDLETIDAARPEVRHQCEILDRALEGRTYLAGDGPSIADCLLAPILHYVGNMPDGMASFEGLEELGRWWHAVSSRPSFKDTVPPMLVTPERAA